MIQQLQNHFSFYLSIHPNKPTKYKYRYLALLLLAVARETKYKHFKLGIFKSHFVSKEHKTKNVKISVNFKTFNLILKFVNFFLGWG